MTTATGTWKVARIRGHRVRFQHTGTLAMTPWLRFEFDPKTKSVTFLETAYAMRLFVGHLTQMANDVAAAFVKVGTVVGEAVSKFNDYAKAASTPVRVTVYDESAHESMAEIIVPITETDLPLYRVPTLRAVATELGITGTSKMTKAVLIETILKEAAA